MRPEECLRSSGLRDGAAHRQAARSRPSLPRGHVGRGGDVPEVPIPAARRTVCTAPIIDVTAKAELLHLVAPMAVPMPLVLEPLEQCVRANGLQRMLQRLLEAIRWVDRKLEQC